jgi:hypothetical protein
MSSASSGETPVDAGEPAEWEEPPQGRDAPQSIMVIVAALFPLAVIYGGVPDEVLTLFFGFRD